MCVCVEKRPKPHRKKYIYTHMCKKGLEHESMATVTKGKSRQSNLNAKTSFTGNMGRRGGERKTTDYETV